MNQAPIPTDSHDEVLEVSLPSLARGSEASSSISTNLLVVANPDLPTTVDPHDNSTPAQLDGFKKVVNRRKKKTSGLRQNPEHHQ
ncbi:hypothetical protein Dimus_018391, partial [Dionaea muscipula]